MEIKRVASTGLDQNYHVAVGAQEMSLLQDAVANRLVEVVATKIAEDFIRERGAELLSSIPLAAVINLAVAKVAVGIGEASKR